MAKETETAKAFVFDGETGEQIVRDLNADEIADIAKSEKELKARQAELKAKATARASALAKLAELGLTAEEIAAL
jgi:DNA-binding NarL/FixJ family response regulator